MPSLELNLKVWDRDYDWSSRKDEWSAPWGSTEAEWRFTLLPRLLGLLPARRILEIAPGFGRWTQYLHPLCNRLTVVDLSEKCLAACKERFADIGKIDYYRTDGKDLSMLPSSAFDLVFCFDSLVHAESDVFEAYLAQLERVLAPDGRGFLHHSNLGEYDLSLSIRDRLPTLFRRSLDLFLGDPREAWRARSMTAARFRTIANASGLACIRQEILDWPPGGGLLTDCLSTFTRKGSAHARPNEVFRNPRFAAEAQEAKRLGQLHA